jgi:hypothetical protein
MDKLLYFVLASYAAWFVFSQSELPVWSNARDWLCLKSPTFSKLVHCPMCSGFWCSLAVAAASRWPFPATILDAAHITLQGLAGAAAVFLIETHVTRLERR